jgi:hypothetical protein
MHAVSANREAISTSNGPSNETDCCCLVECRMSNEILRNFRHMVFITCTTLFRIKFNAHITNIYILYIELGFVVYKMACKKH